MSLPGDKISPDDTDLNVITEYWKKTARSRLHVELAGLAFALKKGATPQEYARHLWSTGAKGWMKAATPGAAEYLLKETEAFRRFYPDVEFEIVKAGKEKAELVFSRGCLGGWGEDPWMLARSLQLTKDDVCGYCRESFLVWARQLGLTVDIGPGEDGTCRLCVTAS